MHTANYNGTRNLTSRGYEGIGPDDLHILYNENILRGGEIIRNIVYLIFRRW